jgi:hypothetical protein
MKIINIQSTALDVEKKALNRRNGETEEGRNFR